MPLEKPLDQTWLFAKEVVQDDVREQQVSAAFARQKPLDLEC
jgi:hypothetical protein